MSVVFVKIVPQCDRLRDGQTDRRMDRHTDGWTDSQDHTYYRTSQSYRKVEGIQDWEQVAYNKNTKLSH